MAGDDFIQFSQWYIMLLILGLAFFPLTSKIFSIFPDKGYPFAKILGLALTSFAVFNLGLSRIFQFDTYTILICIVIMGGATAALVAKKSKVDNKKIKNFFHKHWRIILFEEILFLISLYFLAYIRAFSPDIHGLEKYMDFGFVNSIMRADFFPPKDMWFTPYSINYYYFGHLATAVLTKISFLKTEVTYNLMLATIFAMCVTGGFSIVFNLISQASQKARRGAYFFAIISALILSLGGNLHTIYTFFTPYQAESPVPPWELKFQPELFPNSYWYPNATRFIYNTIHEFPMYSWTVSDLHGHVLDIPFVLLTLAIVLVFSLKHFTGKNGLPLKSLTRYLVLIGLMTSVMYMTNAWDGIIYLLFTVLIVLYFNWQKRDKNIGFLNLLFFKKTLPPNTTFSWALESFIQLGVVGLCFFFFTLPFSISFKPFVSGVGVLCAPNFLVEVGNIGPFLFEADHCQHSPWWQLLILHGFFMFFAISFLIFLKKIKKAIFTDRFVVVLIALSALLILIPEFIYAKDIYPGHYRANTMFKLVFQSFIMLSISTGYIIFRILSYTNTEKIKGNLFIYIFKIVTCILLALVLIYPFQAIESYYGKLKDYKGLDGTKYLKTLYPSDYEAINFINEKLSGQPVILEAQGDAYNGSSSYTDYARVSSNTGLPTVLGWTVHEWLWRGTYDIPAPRIEEVRLMYESDNIEETKRLLDKYRVEYIFIGQLEREKYPLLKADKLRKLGEEVFSNNQTRIIKINHPLRD